MAEGTLKYSVSLHGFPPISHMGGSSSCKSTSDHDRATAISKPFSGLADSHMTPCKSMIWMRFNRKQKLEWNCETDLQSCLVKEVLEDIFFEAGLDMMACRLEMSLFDAKRPDLMLVCDFGVPVGFVEVKKPGKAIEKDEKVFGQMFDHLSYIKNYTGRQHTFGILTSYNQWRFFWLPETDEVAQSDSLVHPPPPRVPIGPKTILPKEPPNWSIDSHPFHHQDLPLINKVSQPERLVSSSGIMKWNDTSTPLSILSCVRKMIYSPMNPIDSLELSSVRSYIYVSPEEWKWIKPNTKDSIIATDSAPVSTKLVITGKSVPSHFQNALLLYDLGGGNDGRVWLGSTIKGKVCVLKFSNNKSLLEQEQEVWNKAWPECKVKVKELNKRWVLIMPWIKPCSEQEFQNEEVKEAIKEAIEKLASVGYVHDDIHQRHVGLYKENSKCKAILFDFAHVSKISENDKSAKIAAITNMMKELNL